MEGNQKLTTEEALRLIDMLKEKVRNPKIKFPTLGGKIEFEAVEKNGDNQFIININRSGIRTDKCTYQARTADNNTILLRLDISPTIVHTNPNGEKIIGNHLHVYSEEHESAEAIPFNIDDTDLYKNCLDFFNHFNLIYDKNDILYQEQFI